MGVLGQIRLSAQRCHPACPPGPGRTGSYASWVRDNHVVAFPGAACLPAAPGLAQAGRRLETKGNAATPLAHCRHGATHGAVLGKASSFVMLLYSCGGAAATENFSVVGSGRMLHGPPVQ